MNRGKSNKISRLCLGDWYLTTIVMRVCRNKLLSIIKILPQIFLIETIYIQCNSMAYYGKGSFCVSDTQSSPA